MRYSNEIIRRFGNDYVVSGEEYLYNCPFCLKRRGKADDDRKLYVSGTHGYFHCFKCDAKGTVVSKVNVSTSGVYEDLCQLFKDSSIDKDDGDEDNTFYVPNVRIPKDSVAYEYCISRGITDDMIDFYDIRLGMDELFGRIVIPNETFGIRRIWTDMYSARSYLNQNPKYMNPHASKKSGVVFNLHNIKEGSDVYVVEGAITAIHAGRDAVAVYGCHPSNIQLQNIMDKNPRNIFCVLDNDEAGRPGNEDMARRFSSRFSGNVYIVYMPSGVDAADIGESRFKEYVDKNKILYGSGIYASVASYLKR